MKDYLFKEAYEFSKQFTKISTALFMRKYKIKYDYALKLCNKIRLKNRSKARKLAKDVENS